MNEDKTSLKEKSQHLSKSDYDLDFDFTKKQEDRIPEAQGDLADRADADIEAEMNERIANIRRQLRHQPNS